MTAPTPLQPSTRRNHRRRKTVRWIKRGLLIAGGLAAIGLIVRAWIPSPIAVDVAVARRAQLRVEVTEDGRTRVHDRFVVSAPIAGNLERITLDPGTPVRAGDALAHLEPLDPAMLDQRTRDEASARALAAAARVHQADTSVTRATVARDAAIRDADRTRTLAAREAIPAVEREHAEVAEQLAIGDLEAATRARAVAAAELAAARAVLGDRRGPRGTRVDVVAPAAGQVLRVVRDSAGPVAAGSPLVELGDPRAIEVLVDVLSSDAARIVPGMPVGIEAWGGDRALTGRVRLVEPSAFTKLSALGVEEQRVNIIVAIDSSAPASLGDGFRIEARIVVWQGEVLAVPTSAVFRDRGKWMVYVVADGRAQAREVTIGHRGTFAVEIVGGLTGGERVIEHPSDRIAPGVRVDPRE